MTISGFNSMQLNLYKNDNLMIIRPSDSLNQTQKHYYTKAQYFKNSTTRSHYTNLFCIFTARSVKPDQTTKRKPILQRLIISFQAWFEALFDSRHYFRDFNTITIELQDNPKWLVIIHTYYLVP